MIFSLTRLYLPYDWKMKFEADGALSDEGSIAIMRARAIPVNVFINQFS